MMNCPNCGQEMVDRKEYCINCGKKLVNDKTVSKKPLIFVILGLLIVGVLVCYMIINYNTGSEIEPYIEDVNVTDK